MQRFLISLGAAFVIVMLVFSAMRPKTSDLVPLGPPPEDEWYQANVLASPRPVLIDFSASWCGPCQMQHKVLDDLKQEYDGRVDILTVDVDQQSVLSDYFQVKYLPTLVVMRNGNLLDRKQGYTAAGELRSSLNAALASAP